MKTPGNSLTRLRAATAAALVFACLLSTCWPAAFAQDEDRSAWTTAGSDGAVDETSKADYEFLGDELRHRAGRLLAVKARYNITQTPGLEAIFSCVCPDPETTAPLRIPIGPGGQVAVRFRDSDEDGPAAQVLLTIYEVNIFTGVIRVMYEFDSNDPQGTISAIGLDGMYVSTECAPDVTFDFSNNAYWVDATVFRTSTAAQSGLGGVQIAPSDACGSLPPVS